jgi:dTDP-4-dehydrorhamnose reductase
VKVLVLGVTGMIGKAIYHGLGQDINLEVWGTVRSCRGKSFFAANHRSSLMIDVRAENIKSVAEAIEESRSDMVINCIGITKHRPDVEIPYKAITVNALFPNQLADLCISKGVRLLHISTDCVFSGQKGNYSELDTTDAEDLYGKTKALGEVVSENILTIRTATIGHEYDSQLGLLEWFLAQQACKGFGRAIFSGLTTIELARVIRDIIVPNASLSGLYHIGGSPIDKWRLLKLISKIYRKSTNIELDNEFVIDRSLSTVKFANKTGYSAPNWPTLIQTMHDDYLLRK